MKKTIYATYDDQSKANKAFAELLQRGVHFMDVLLITSRAYLDQNSNPSDGRLGVLEPGEQADQLDINDSSGLSIPPEEDIPMRDDPFGDAGGVWLLDNIRYPGDITTCLIELGFAPQLARDIETTILEGGAILILRLPSGPVDDLQGWHSMERYGGTILAPLRTNPYLG